MIRAYSQRLLPPFSGMVQIAESTRARAHSFDGIDWEIQYLPWHGPADRRPSREPGYALDRGYFRVAALQDKRLNTYVLPSCLDAVEVTAAIDELAAFLADATIPFPTADTLECWLLDGSNDKPLALLYSCCTESQKQRFPNHLEWTALPHSKMKIDNTAAERERQEAPVNHRFQQLVAKRAGANPRVAWYDRSVDPQDNFPCFLVREDWPDEAAYDLCQRYLQRKSPRLLMLQGLTPEDRDRLEIAAKDYATEVDRYYPLYPEINDQQRMSAIRVEARLRRNAPQQSNTAHTNTNQQKGPMDKRMRIFET